jgi:signal transduction histidine kinase/PAS domain-containing protein/ActR/RegA family two-component response regulator
MTGSGNPTSSTDADVAVPRTTTRLHGWAEQAWWPLPVLAASLVLLRLIESPAAYPWPHLQLMLQLVFMFGGACFVCFVAARGFLLHGNAGVLLLGCGAIAVGLAGVLANLTSVPNVMVTIHNLSMWVGAWLHFIGALVGSQRRVPQRGLWLAIAYAATLATVLAIVAAASAGVTPPFFVQDRGGTMLRQFVLGSTVLMFAASALVLLRHYRAAREAVGFRRWYAHGLLLLALGLAGVWLQVVTPSLLTWAAILTQILGAVYLMAAARCALHLERALAMPFGNTPDSVALRYALAPLFVGTAAVLRLLFEGAQASAAPYEAMLPAVLLAALFGGIGPGALAAAVALLLGELLWTAPDLRFAFSGDASWGVRGLFLFNAALLVVVGLALQRLRERTQAAQGEARWRALFDSIDHGVCVCEMLCDHTGRAVDYRFLEVNPAFGPMTGLPNAAGKTALELVPTLERRWIDTYARVALGGETLHFEDGSAPMGRHFEVFASPIETPRCFVVRFADVTERRRAQVQLAAVAARDAFGNQLASALRPLADPLSVQTTAARVLGQWLKAHRVAYFEVHETEYVVESDWTDGVPSVVGRHPRAAFGAPLLAEYSAGRTVHSPDVAADVTLSPAERAAYAAVQNAAFVGVPLVKGGVLVGGLTVHSAVPRSFTPDEVLMIEDTAEATWASVERARSEAALREADRRKDEFIATLAHELRNPLAPVRHAAEVLALAQRDAPTRHAWATAVISRQVKQMSLLIDDLLDVSRISRGELRLRRQRVALAAVIQQALETSRPLIDQCGHTLTVHVSPAPVHVDADALRLAQVFANLLNNAAKYSERGSHIELAVRSEPETVLVTVRDEGVGIAADMLPRVFEPFAQGRIETAHSQGGLGIGLTLVKRLVELHGGGVAAASEGPGRGSAFSVHLPRLPDEAPAEPEAPPPVQPQVEEATTRRRRVLVVDDNRDAAQSLAELLTLCGHDARAAFSGDDGLALAETFEPEVVLLDLGMPGRDGWSTLRAMRERAWAQTALIIAVTGWGQPQEHARTTEAGFDGHLVKPVDPDRLLRLLAQERVV